MCLDSFAASLDRKRVQSNFDMRVEVDGVFEIDSSSGPPEKEAIVLNVVLPNPSQLRLYHGSDRRSQNGFMKERAKKSRNDF